MGHIIFDVLIELLKEPNQEYVVQTTLKTMPNKTEGRQIRRWEGVFVRFLSLSGVGRLEGSVMSMLNSRYALISWTQSERRSCLLVPEVQLLKCGLLSCSCDRELTRS